MLAFVVEAELAETLFTTAEVELLVPFGDDTVTE